jgi:predicted phage terminase large subunit-like protein
LELVRLTKLDNLRRARTNLLDFTLYTKEDYQANWHHVLVCRYLTDFAMGRIKRLMIFAPPRHGKSELVSRRLPPFIFGLNPDSTIISATYTQPLAESMNRDVQRVIDHPAYAEIFPKTQLYGSNVRTLSQTSWLRNSDAFEIVGHKGIYRCAGVGGALTGFGMNFGLVDDPIKNAEEADSRLVRDRLWEWFGSVFMTRLEKNGQILITQTRWHEDDLSGRVMRQMKEDLNKEGWVVLSLPAMCETQRKHDHDPRAEGEPLWPEKYDREALASFRRNLGTRGFSALYQQRPTALEGGIIKREWIKYYVNPPNVYDRQISSWDTSFKKTTDGSFVVGQVWQARGADRYLLYQFRDRVDFPGTIRAIRETSKRYQKVHAHIIEDKANGSAIISTLSKEISGIVPIKADISKEARLSAVSAQFEAGNVYLPDKSICPWIEDYVDEICTFPNAEHDDQVDATSQALDHLRSSGGVGSAYVINF